MMKKPPQHKTSHPAILGSIIAKKRKNLYDQGRAAEKSGINRSTWSRMENGEYVPDALQLHKIASVLGTSVHVLLSDFDNDCKKLEETGVQVSTGKSTQKSAQESTQKSTKKPTQESNDTVGLFLAGAVLIAFIALISGGKGGGK